MIARGYRPGNFKPSFETIEAVERALLAAGVPIPTHVRPPVIRNSDWEKVPAKKKP